MLAVIKTGGKQYKVASGDVIRVEKLAGAPGDSIALGSVLAVVDGARSEFSAQKLAAVKVGAEILRQEKTDKVIVFKKNRRQNYRRKNGHRQEVTVLKIGAIALDGNVSVATAKPAAKKATEKATEKAAEKPAAAKKEKTVAKKPAATKAPATKPKKKDA
jgi:large subunit ribosomal protein L21